jgi:hypothetical protein
MEKPFSASSSLERAYHICKEYNMKEDAERLLVAIREIGPKVASSMGTTSHEMEIPRDELNTYLEAMMEGDVEDVLIRIAMHFITQRTEIENRVKQLAHDYPISFLFTTQILDDQGRKVASVNSLESDLDGNIVHHMAQDLSFSVVFLMKSLEEAERKFNLNSSTLFEYLSQSPVFTYDRKSFLLRGLQAYFQQDYLITIHLLVPQIETAIRNLVEMSGGQVLKQSRGGGFHLRTLDDLFRTQEVVQIFNEDVALYFRVVLTDQRGWNIRNDVCHGIASENKFSRGIADRLIHILLVLALLREHDKSSDE